MRGFLVGTAVFAVLFGLAALGWHAFEGRWDNQLFNSSEDTGTTFCNFSAREAAEFLKAHPEVTVLDVRSRAEYEGGFLPGGVHLPLAEEEAFEARLSEMSRDQPYLIYCAGGYRSRKAFEKMKAAGFTRLYHLHRGYLSWQWEDLPREEP